MDRMPDFSRRRTLLAGASVAALSSTRPRFTFAAEDALQTRPIPSSGERLPIIGIGTAVIFDFENDAAKFGERREVLKTLAAGGGKLIDTAHSYGRAEDRLGELMADTGLRDKLFIATKYSSGAARDAATASLQNSLRRLKTNRIDLMQAWNVGDANFDFGQLREWKKEGLCRYVGMTTSFDSQYAAIGKVLAREKPDFFQVNYSLGDRDAEEHLLPAARGRRRPPGDKQPHRPALLINLPFGRNSMFRKVGNRPLPDFAAEFGATSWAQFFLKFILSHPAVTAVIPGTDKPEYMIDNLKAGRGAMPDTAMRQRIIKYWNTL
jgi:aryl-alcohol dehydrogenase-like predicted oxidoreductase